MINIRELEVLNILWNTDKPLMASSIVNMQEELTQSTVTAVLRKLLKENLVEVAGVAHSGKVLSRLYRPTELSKEVLLQDFADQYYKFRSVISKSELLKAMLDKDSDMDKKEIARDIADIKNVLKDFK